MSKKKPTYSASWNQIRLTLRRRKRPTTWVLMSSSAEVKRGPPVVLPKTVHYMERAERNSASETPSGGGKNGGITLAVAQLLLTPRTRGNNQTSKANNGRGKGLEQRVRKRESKERKNHYHSIKNSAA